MQLDFQAKFVSAVAYAHSSFNTHRSQWRSYLWFCTTYHLVPVPTKVQTIIRFLIHLSYYCKYSTVIKYLSAINVLHRHFGFNVTFEEVFSIKPVLRRLRRILGDAPVQKLPITPDILLWLHPQFTAWSDSGFWAAMLIGFDTFFRKSNLVPKSEKDLDPAKNLSPRHRCRTVGFGICVRWSKTIQFWRQLLIPVLRLSQGHPLCSVHAYERHILEFPVSQLSPAFLHYRKDHDIPITHSAFTDKLRKVLSHTGFPANKFSGHSFHHGEASYAFRCSAPVELSVSKGTGLRTLFCFVSHNHLSGGSLWWNWLPKTLTIQNFYL